MTVPDDDHAPVLARRQGGAFSREQALAAGWSRHEVQGRLTSGRWRRVAGRALTARPEPDPPLRLAWAARLTWPCAIVGFETAAALLNLPLGAHGDDRRAMPGWGSRPSRSGRPNATAGTQPPVVVYVGSARRASRGLVPVQQVVGEDDVVWVGGVAITAWHRTAIDLLACRPWPQALDLYAWLTSRRLLGHATVVAAIEDRARLRGTTQLRRLVEFTADGAVSVAEQVAHDLLRRAGITGWQANARVLGPDGAVVAVVDLLFARARLVVEIDGRRAHGGREAFQGDRTRQNLLVSLGFRVLRFTWRDLIDRPEDVVHQIQALL